MPELAIDRDFSVAPSRLPTGTRHTPNSDWHVRYTEYLIRAANGIAHQLTPEEVADMHKVMMWLDSPEDLDYIWAVEPSLKLARGVA